MLSRHKRREGIPYKLAMPSLDSANTSVRVVRTSQGKSADSHDWDGVETAALCARNLVS